jgi:hypothetical protein
MKILQQSQCCPKLRFVQVQEAKEITTQKPKYEYESKTLMIPQTITRSRVVYETKMIPIQVLVSHDIKAAGTAF